MSRHTVTLFAVVLACAAAAHAQERPIGTWSFEPAPDDFRPHALLDLRGLNEKTAGQSGFVRRSPDGSDFVLGDGQPARFWAMNTGFVGGKRNDAPDPAALASHARFLAKHGVNMVRFHGQLSPVGKGAALTAINAAERERCWQLVAAMKREGIYTTISPYWANAFKLQPGWGLAGPPDQSANGLLFFDPALQAAYKAWLKALLAERNPYTGLPLAEDPAVAIIQLQNEDSLLFWTAQALSPEQQAALGRRFGEWLVKKYGSLDQARSAWAGDTLKTDDFAKGVVGLHLVWEYTQARSGGRGRRLDDQLQFTAETMHRFNREMGEYLRKELGCRQLINAGNWKTADGARLGDVERWSYTANDVIAVNRYFGGVHTGEKSGWAIEVGDQFTSPSVLLDPRRSPLVFKQVAGFPSIISESSWVPPLAYQAEGPFLVAVYQSLTGVDAFYWFSTGVEQWWQPQSANGYVPAIGKWVCATPELLGQFPAAALLYRKGYVRRGEPVVQERRPLADLWQRRIPVISEEPSFDPNRDAGDQAARGAAGGAVNPLAFAVGPVLVGYGAAGPSKAAVPPGAINEAAKVIRSVTGEVEWDYGKGLLTLRTPKAVGACGFLRKGGPIKLGEVQIEATNDYGSVLVVALDDQPLRESTRVLVQVGTQSRPAGWQQRPALIRGKEGTYEGFEVQSFGQAPWQVTEAAVRVRLLNPRLKTATKLDPNGYPAGAAAVDLANGAIHLQFPPDALYAVLR